jgi:hypothetical protein
MAQGEEVAAFWKNLKKKANGRGMHSATLGVSTAAWCLAVLRRFGCQSVDLASKARSGMPMEEVAETLCVSKVHVLEGVAGIGKTYMLGDLGDALTRRSVARAISNLEEYLKNWPNVVEEDDPLAVFGNPESVCATEPCRTQLTVIQLHPGSSYEEIVGGVRPIAGDFRWMPGALTKAIESAQRELRNGNRRFHLVMLDEMNRCNLPSVLGEVMLLLEGSRRVECSLPKDDYPEPGEALDEWKSAGKAVELPSARNQRYDSEKKSNGKKKPDSSGDDSDTTPAPSETETTGESANERRQEYWLWVPSNVLILGTMNSSDRSILGFDQALRRRFPPTRLEPHTVRDWLEQLKTWEKNKEIQTNQLGLVLGEIFAWAAINVMLRARIGPDAMIGHSYLYEAFEHRASDEPTLKAAFSRMWQHGILPQMIHAAESARQLEFVQRLFDDGEQVRALFEPKESLGVFQGIDEAVRANGFRSKDEFEELCCEFGVVGTSVSLRHLLKTVGQGHGRRLLVVSRKAGKDSRDPEEWKRVCKGILEAISSEDGETSARIKELLGRLEPSPNEGASGTGDDKAS